MVKTTPYKKRTSNLNLYEKLQQVYELLQKGMPPSHKNEEGKEENSICSILGYSPSKLSYYLRILRTSGFIEKVGMIWEIRKEFSQKQVQKSTRVASNNPLTLQNIPKGKNRGHAFQFKVILYNIQGWTNERRRKYLTKLGIDWYPLNHLIGGGEGIIFKNRTVHLTNSSIIIYEKASYVSNFARVSKSHAIYDLLRLTREIGRSLRANLFPGGKIKFRVTRQHHAIVKNSLAKQYTKRNKKLQIYTGRGLTYLIDNSFLLEEFEAVHKRTANKDMDDKIVPFFQSLDKYPITPEQIYKIQSEQGRNINFLIESVNTIINHQKGLPVVLNRLKQQIKEHLGLIQEYRKENVAWRRSKVKEIRKELKEGKQTKLTDF